MERKPPPTAEDDDSIPQPWEDREPTLACWRKHRDRLMRSEAPGRRPSVWWRYDKGMEPPPCDEESALLWRMGELQGAERAQVETWWRMEYDDAHDMDDRTRHWRWHEIPLELVKKWDAEKRGAAPRIQELKAASRAT